MSTPVYKSEDIYLFRLRTITDIVSKSVLYHVFHEETKNRPTSMSLLYFYEKNNVQFKKFKKNLNTSQVQVINHDPTGKSFDITLLFQCIQWCGKHLASKDDEMWKEGNNCLESLLTTVKSKRNDLSHGKPSLNAKQFFAKTEELRKILTETLSLAGERYKIPENDTKGLISEMNRNINLLRDESLIPLDWNDYKKQNIFSEKLKYVKTNGINCLCQLYQNWIYVAPASFICKHNFKVNDIYTKMILEKDPLPGEDNGVEFEDLLDNTGQNVGDPIILIEGDAGIGKTTLTKKIMNDWVSRNSTITSLTSYDLLLYAECRNNNIQSFKDLVTTLMPDVAVSFQDNDFVHVILNLKVIVIVDGLDELNKSSTCLFSEIMELKRTHGITVLATSRPERVNTYYSMANSYQIKTKHIKLIGIPEQRREEFVIKYFEEMTRRGQTNQDVKGLLKYLKRTAHILSNLWSLPYNLTLLIILWIYKSAIINDITTAPELYWAIHQLLLSKLLERLLNNELTFSLPESSVKCKINNFMYTFCYEAFVGLKHDDINLSEESFKRLEDACIREGLPPEEMTGAFLKKIIMKGPHWVNVKYSFPHKGLQDFLSALYIFKEATSEIGRHLAADVLQDIQNILSLRCVPEAISQDILIFADDRMKRSSQDVITSTSTGVPTQRISRIRNIFDSLHGSSQYSLSKYKNVLTNLIGFFHLESTTSKNGQFLMENISIRDNVKLEVLELLKLTGVLTRHDWLQVLESVKCDEYVANFISQQHGIFKGDIEIRDATLFGHLSLLRALNKPVENEKEVNVTVNIKTETSGINELLDEVNKKNLNVQKLYFQPDFRRPTNTMISEESLNKTFERSSVLHYRGAVTPTMKISSTTTNLFVSVADEECYERLMRIMAENRVTVDLCILPTFDISLLKPSPRCIRFLYIPDIIDTCDVSKASAIASLIKPKKSSFRRMYFPRNSLEPHQILELIEEMGCDNVQVEESLVFPSRQKPTMADEEQRLQLAAKKTLKCTGGLSWGKDNMGFSIDDW